MQILYLARRDKNHVEILGAMKSQPIFTNKILITDVNKNLKDLPEEEKFKIANYYFEKRMHYDLYIQDFPNYMKFRNYMLSQGYKEIPTGLQPLFFENKNAVAQTSRPYVKKMMQRKKTWLGNFIW